MIGVGQARQRIPGSAGFPNLSPQQSPVAINSMIIHAAPQVSSAISVSGQELLGLLAIDDNTGLNIFNWTSRLNAGGATGLFDRAVIAFIQNNMSVTRAILSCYAEVSGLRHLD